jgi:hypothetical protein
MQQTTHHSRLPSFSKRKSLGRKLGHHLPRLGRGDLRGQFPQSRRVRSPRRHGAAMLARCIGKLGWGGQFFTDHPESRPQRCQKYFFIQKNKILRALPKTFIFQG